ncbi:MAG: cytochrome-c oxidase, cbb3-type subunit III, partial [Spongiibacteraceae bacterium]|nr:cytochrome-c oxidase, cbb3-type subunit III [Spongiibacteraceae bacterium]
DRYAAMPIEEVAQDPQARQMGQRLFANNCSQCHGVDARGSFGFPNLTDNDWLWGSSPEQIRQTITHGRQGVMPGWESVLGNKGVVDVTAYVLSLSGREAPAGDINAGEQAYKTVCATCHGPEGKGDIAFGAPNLTDDIWLYGSSPAWIQQTVRYGRNNVMPAFGENLEPAKIHLLVAYVWGLSNLDAKETASR